MRAPHAHPLRRNDRNWSPRLVGFFDTEFPSDPWRPRSPQLFKCACAQAVRRRGQGALGLASNTLRTDDPQQLADWVEEVCGRDEPLWLYAHHAAVDVQSSQLIDNLMRRGWRLSRHGLANPNLWALLVKGRQSLHLCDSMSLFGVSEERLGEMLMLPKLKIPGYGDDLQRWLDYCQRDVEIGMAALLQVLADWDEHKLGRWTDTGPGCGWNSLRHTIGDRHVWIQPDDCARAFERQAIYAGRREVFRFGALPEWDYCDLDLEHAHTSVAVNFPLPKDRGRKFDSLALDSPLILRHTVGIIASVVVKPDVPRYPLRTPAGVVYPVGEFETVLCGPEIREANDWGELLSIGPGYCYTLSNWAHSWSHWIAQVLDHADPTVGPMLYQLLKGASKTVWGRSALRVTGRVADMDGESDELRLERGHDMERDVRWVAIDYGFRRRKEYQDAEGDDSFPAILAWIQSWLRVILGRLVDALGPDAVVQVATDGVLVAPWRLAEVAWEAQEEIDQPGDLYEVATAACRVLDRDVEPLRVRLKDVLHHVRLLGPETLESAEGRKVSGVPAKAERLGPWRYKGEVWPSFVTMTHAAISGAVLVTERTFDCSRVRPLRWIHRDGCCQPLRTARTAAGGFEVLAPAERDLCPHGAPVGPEQHVDLAALRAGGGRLAAVGASSMSPAGRSLSSGPTLGPPLPRRRLGVETWEGGPAAPGPTTSDCRPGSG